MKRVITEILIVTAVILLAGIAAQAQILRQGDTEAIVGTLGFPCEPGETIFGFYPCPPISSQGVLIYVRADDWRTAGFDSYSVTVNYRTASGELKSTTSTVKRAREFGQSWDDGWRAVGFNIGRVQTPTLSGIIVESVAVAKVPPPVVITVGKTEFSAPK